MLYLDISEAAAVVAGGFGERGRDSCSALTELPVVSPNLQQCSLLFDVPKTELVKCDFTLRVASRSYRVQWVESRHTRAVYTKYTAVARKR